MTFVVAGIPSGRVRSSPGHPTQWVRSMAGPQRVRRPSHMRKTMNERRRRLSRASKVCVCVCECASLFGKRMSAYAPVYTTVFCVCELSPSVCRVCQPTATPQTIASNTHWLSVLIVRPPSAYNRSVSAPLLPIAVHSDSNKVATHTRSPSASAKRNRDAHTHTQRHSLAGRVFFGGAPPLTENQSPIALNQFWQTRASSACVCECA